VCVWRAKSNSRSGIGSWQVFFGAKNVLTVGRRRRVVVELEDAFVGKSAEAEAEAKG
jgi:hypothetical protein